MENNKKEELLQQYNHLLNHYKFIPQEQINNYVRQLITSQSKHLSELIINFISQGFYRARTHNHLEGIISEKKLNIFSCESQFWNPPIEFCKNRGRCNDINESLLYCSSELSTSVIETRPTKGEFITIANFKIKNPSTYKGARVKFIGLKSLSKIEKLKNILNDDYIYDIEKIELDETLDELFHKKVPKDDENLYRLSIAVTKSMMATLLDKQQGVFYQMHGMIYPSIEHNKEHFNIIYRPEHARQHYYINQLRTFEVLESNEKSIILKEKRIGNLKPTIIMDPFDFFGINWKNSEEEKILKINI